MRSASSAMMRAASGFANPAAAARILLPTAGSVPMRLASLASRFDVRFASSRTTAAPVRAYAYALVRWSWLTDSGIGMRMAGMPSKCGPI